MIFKIYFDFFLDTKSVQGKEKILSNITRLLVNQYGCASVNHIENNQFIITFEIDTWENLIFRLIEFSQTIGRQWIITGSINDDLSLWSNDSRMVGVNCIGVSVDKLNL